MLRPVSLLLTWSPPLPALDLMDPSSTSGGANHPGLYLHVIAGTNGDVATYVGKAERSIRDRQAEHAGCYIAGKYNIYDDAGGVVHQAFAARAQNHIDLLADQLARTRIYVAQVSGAPIDSLVLSAAESLLLHSPSRVFHPRININGCAGSGGFTAFDRFALVHSGNSDPQHFFSSRTEWDRASGTIQ